MKQYEQLIHHPTATATDRSTSIGGTDARVIASGQWYDLYLEKIGQKAAINLDHVWKPRLGKETEKLHAWWHGHTTGEKLKRIEDVPMVTPKSLELIPFGHATFDYWTMATDQPLELKHTNERNDLRGAADFYMPQLQWQMLIGGVMSLRFSIIRGNNEPEWGHVEYDHDYVDKLLGQVRAFWWHVENQSPPDVDGASAKEAATSLGKAAKLVPLNGLRPYDMTGNNEWAVAAADFIRDKRAAESLKATEPKIRGMIPEDASVVEGHGLSFKRDARGAYRVTIDE